VQRAQVDHDDGERNQSGMDKRGHCLVLQGDGKHVVLIDLGLSRK
jgi:hypothetical protein